MPSFKLSTLCVAFILMLSVSILTDAHTVKMTRRSSDQPTLNLELIMQDDPDLDDGTLWIFTLNATVAFKVTMPLYDGKGHTQYVVTDHSGRVSVVLDSHDDHCYRKTHYKDKHGLRIEIDPRGPITDRWYLSFAAIPGVEFEFKRYVFHESGDIINKSSKKVVATLRVEKRKEPWIRSRFQSPNAYVLRTDGTISISDLATFMALVQWRTSICGL
ncbi:hypothetical protein CROQUDRAFT_712395 [Cronartium quercuum f. sp. fusiforme G11]|uniref:Uncharacterized protein n=1 Tax=Cronartium quercuum f. sp. fusiforme G11 TaxID=708437 RepID=A0A9P6NSF9_9BASI|nr:hypothetical protein CROQUDRAFT_712395 [Cronartium quercuum f. sp. fusiforme G11]